MKKKLFVLAGILAFVAVFGLCPNTDAAIIHQWDFDDGTLQGWTPEPFFGGKLDAVPTGGNPGGFMAATDTVAGRGGLAARAPGLDGDLTFLESIAWDEFVPDRGSQTGRSTCLWVRGVDGTIYLSSNSPDVLGAWNARMVHFDVPSEWTKLTGEMSFAELLTQVEGIFMEMETSARIGYVESAVDNIVVRSSTPVPGAFWLLGSGLVGFGWLKKRRRTGDRN